MEGVEQVLILSQGVHWYQPRYDIGEGFIYGVVIDRRCMEHQCSSQRAVLNIDVIQFLIYSLL
jgi:hypothetical protein